MAPRVKMKILLLLLWIFSGAIMATDTSQSRRHLLFYPSHKYMPVAPLNNEASQQTEQTNGKDIYQTAETDDDGEVYEGFGDTWAYSSIMMHRNDIVISVIIVVLVVYVALILWTLQKRWYLDEIAQIKVLSPSRSGTGGRHPYLITIVTGSRHGGGVYCGQVVLSVHGKDGASGEYIIPAEDRHGTRPFTRGCHKRFLIHAPTDLGDILYVSITLESDWQPIKWYLKYMTVKNLSDRTQWYLPCHGWLAARRGRHANIHLLTGSADTKATLFMENMWRVMLEYHLWLSPFTSLEISKALHQMLLVTLVFLLASSVMFCHTIVYQTPLINSITNGTSSVFIWFIISDVTCFSVISLLQCIAKYIRALVTNEYNAFNELVFRKNDGGKLLRFKEDYQHIVKQSDEPFSNSRYPTQTNSYPLPVTRNNYPENKTENLIEDFDQGKAYGPAEYDTEEIYSLPRDFMKNPKRYDTDTRVDNSDRRNIYYSLESSGNISEEYVNGNTDDLEKYSSEHLYSLPRDFEKNPKKFEWDNKGIQKPKSILKNSGAGLTESDDFLPNECSTPLSSDYSLARGSADDIEVNPHQQFDGYSLEKKESISANNSNANEIFSRRFTGSAGIHETVKFAADCGRTYGNYADRNFPMTASRLQTLKLDSRIHGKMIESTTSESNDDQIIQQMIPPSNLHCHRQSGEDNVNVHSRNLNIQALNNDTTENVTSPMQTHMEVHQFPGDIQDWRSPVMQRKSLNARCRIHHTDNQAIGTIADQRNRFGENINDEKLPTEVVLEQNQSPIKSVMTISQSDERDKQCVESVQSESEVTLTSESPKLSPKVSTETTVSDSNKESVCIENRWEELWNQIKPHVEVISPGIKQQVDRKYLKSTPREKVDMLHIAEKMKKLENKDDLKDIADKLIAVVVENAKASCLKDEEFNYNMNNSLGASKEEISTFIRKRSTELLEQDSRLATITLGNIDYSLNRESTTNLGQRHSDSTICGRKTSSRELISVNRATSSDTNMTHHAATYSGPFKQVHSNTSIEGIQNRMSLKSLPRSLSFTITAGALENSLGMLEDISAQRSEETLNHCRVMTDNILNMNETVSKEQGFSPAMWESATVTKRPSSQIMKSVDMEMAEKLSDESITQVACASIQNVFSDDVVERVQEAVFSYSDAHIRDFATSVVEGLYAKMKQHLKQAIDDKCSEDISEAAKDNMVMLIHKAEAEIRTEVLPPLTEHIMLLLEEEAEAVKDFDVDVMMMVFAGQYIETVVTNAVLQTHVDITKQICKVKDTTYLESCNNNNNTRCLASSWPNGHTTNGNNNNSENSPSETSSFTSAVSSDDDSMNQQIVLRQVLEHIHKGLKSLSTAELSQRCADDSRICCALCKNKAIADISQVIYGSAASKYLIYRALTKAEEFLQVCCEEIDSKKSESDQACLVALGQALLNGVTGEQHFALLESATDDLRDAALAKAMELVAQEFIHGQVEIKDDEELRSLVRKLRKSSKLKIEELAMGKSISHGKEKQEEFLIQFEETHPVAENKNANAGGNISDSSDEEDDLIQEFSDIRCFLVNRLEQKFDHDSDLDMTWNTTFEGTRHDRSIVDPYGSFIEDPTAVETSDAEQEKSHDSQMDMSWNTTFESTPRSPTYINPLRKKRDRSFSDPDDTFTEIRAAEEPNQKEIPQQDSEMEMSWNTVFDDTTSSSKEPEVSLFGGSPQNIIQSTKVFKPATSALYKPAVPVSAIQKTNVQPKQTVPGKGSMENLLQQLKAQQKIQKPPMVVPRRPEEYIVDLESKETDNLLRDSKLQGDDKIKDIYDCEKYGKLLELGGFVYDHLKPRMIPMFAAFLMLFMLIGVALACLLVSALIGDRLTNMGSMHWLLYYFVALDIHFFVFEPLKTLLITLYWTYKKAEVMD